MNELTANWSKIVHFMSPWLWHSLWTGFLLWGALVLVLYLCAPRRPETRYRLFVGALATWIVLIGAARIYLQSSETERDLVRAFSDANAFVAELTQEPAQAEDLEESLRLPAPTHDAVELPPAVLPSTPSESAVDARAVAVPVILLPSAPVADPSVPFTIPSRRVIRIAEELLRNAESWLIGIWALGLSLGLARMAYGAMRLRRVTQRGIPLESPQAEELQELVAVTAPRYSVRLGVLSDAHDALTSGVRRPTIWLPKSWLMELSPAALEQVVLHELAHVVRRDVAHNLIERFVTCLLWFHPIVWRLTERIRFEREACCDAWVVRQTGNPAAYGELLASVGSLTVETAPMKYALGMAAPHSALLERVERVLGAKPRAERRALVRALAASCVAVALLAAIVLVPVLPSLAADDGAHDEVQPTALDNAAIDPNPPASEPPPTDVDQTDSTPRVAPHERKIQVWQQLKLDFEVPKDSKDVAGVNEPIVRPGAGTIVTIPITKLVAQVNEPIVQRGGDIVLWPTLGRIHVAGLTIDEAEQAILKRVKDRMWRAPARTPHPDEPRLQVTLLEPYEVGAMRTGAPPIKPGDTLEIIAVDRDNPLNLIDGMSARNYTVEPEGTIALGARLGRVALAGATADVAERVLAEHLQRYTKPIVPLVTVVADTKQRVRHAHDVYGAWQAQIRARQPVSYDLMQHVLENIPWVLEQDNAAESGDEIIRAGDVLQLLVDGLPREAPLNGGDRLVQRDGDIVLGPIYGRVKVAGMDLAAAEKAVGEYLIKEAGIRAPGVQLMLVRPNVFGFGYEQPNATKILPGSHIYIHVDGTPEESPVRGLYRVEPNGHVPLGPPYARVRVGGLTAVEAEKAIDEHLRKFLRAPSVSVATEYIEESDPSAPGGVRVIAFDNPPATANDTAVEIKRLREQVQALESVIKQLRSSLDKSAK